MVGPSFHALLTKATTGDRAAMDELLLLHFRRLTAHIAKKIPPGIQSVISADDIIQDTFCQVIRDIEHCRAENVEAFYAWLLGIAEHRLQDAIRYVKSEKRGGRRRVAQIRTSANESSVADLVELLSAGSHTPSRSAARHEAITALQESIDALPEDYRQAIQLRMLEGRSLEETAAAMQRSPRAVQGLIDRAKKKMRTALGRLSHYQ